MATVRGLRFVEGDPPDPEHDEAEDRGYLYPHPDDRVQAQFVLQEVAHAFGFPTAIDYLDQMAVERSAILARLLPGGPPRCPLCGRWCRKVDAHTWRCSQVFYDDYTGVWEHA